MKSSSTGAAAPVDNGGPPQVSAVLKLDTTEEFGALVAAVSSAHAIAAEADFDARSALQEAREAAVAACMKRQGFEYVPVPYRVVTTDTVIDWWQEIDGIVVPTLPSQRGDVERFGYGVQAPLSMSPIAPPSAEEEANTAYAEGLGAAGQAAYDLALTGHRADDPTTYEEAGGCQGEAWAGFPEPDAASGVRSILDSHADFVQSFRWLIIDGVAVDPRMVAMNRSWADCMEAAGVDHLADAGEEQITPYSALMLALRTAPNGDYWDAREHVADEDEPPEHRSISMSAPEIEIALADFDCRAEVGYERAANEIAVELQRSFINDHGDEVNAFLAALEAAQS
jgi:hypothetical protein